MPRSISRSEPIDQLIVFRGSHKDKAELKINAQKQGMDMSAYIRHILIKEKAISAI